MHNSTKTLEATPKFPGARLVTLIKLHIKDADFRSGLWTSHLNGAFSSAHVNWNAFLYVRANNCSICAENLWRHHIKIPFALATRCPRYGHPLQRLYNFKVGRFLNNELGRSLEWILFKPIENYTALCLQVLRQIKTLERGECEWWPLV